MSLGRDAPLLGADITLNCQRVRIGHVAVAFKHKHILDLDREYSYEQINTLFGARIVSLGRQTHSLFLALDRNKNRFLEGDELQKLSDYFDREEDKQGARKRSKPIDLATFEERYTLWLRDGRTPKAAFAALDADRSGGLDDEEIEYIGGQLDMSRVKVMNDGMSRLRRDEA